MFIGFLQDLSDIVLIYTSGLLDLEAVRPRRAGAKRLLELLRLGSANCSTGRRFKWTVGRQRTEPVTPGRKECKNNTTLSFFSSPTPPACCYPKLRYSAGHLFLHLLVSNRKSKDFLTSFVHYLIFSGSWWKIKCSTLCHLFNSKRHLHFLYSLSMPYMCVSRLLSGWPGAPVGVTIWSVYIVDV